jgi:hypothetical protein
MKKNLNKRTLKLDKETVRALVGTDLQEVIGGKPRVTGGGSCETDCINTCA